VAALAYTKRFSRQGANGVIEVLASVIKATAADTVDFASDVTKVQGAAIISDTKNAPGAPVIPAFATTIVTVPAGYANDDMDMIVVGPGIAP
jgi:hypothetical protein